MKIVVIGGGTGQSVLLRGLKQFTSEITAVVTVADDGGGSGVLRRDLGMLPPGDIRNCIIALASKEPILQDLFTYRFPDGVLKGQSFGNLMIAAMTGISDSFEDAIQKISDIFSITGDVLPVTTQQLTLSAKLKNGEIVVGESKIPSASLRYASPIDHVWISPRNASCSDRVRDSILDADAIVISAGSLYTSIIPALMVKGVSSSIRETNAKVYMIANLMSQRGETDGMTLTDHYSAVLKHTGLEKVDYWFVSNANYSREELEPYYAEGATPLKLTSSDIEFAKNLGTNIVEDSFSEVYKGYIRHDATKISNRLCEIIENNLVRIYNKR